MLGAAGALCCLAAGTALGSWMRLKRMTRFEMVSAAVEMLDTMRLLLETERLSLPELLEACASRAGGNEGSRCLCRRFSLTAQQLREKPMQNAAAAYAQACRQQPAHWERQEEKNVLDTLFSQLGSGTAAMREQAAAACIRRLKPVCEKAHSEAENGGKLCMKLGMLMGLMAGIALW